jgi:hypothetical protein
MREAEKEGKEQISDLDNTKKQEKRKINLFDIIMKPSS